jgi:hypothetical protein
MSIVTDSKGEQVTQTETIQTMTDWVSARTDITGDQQAKLFGPFWGAVGPDERGVGWFWAVFASDRDHLMVATGLASEETAAKAAACAWVGRNR